VDTFADLMRECPITNKRFRADQVEPQNGLVFSYCGAWSKNSEELANSSLEGKEYSRRIIEMLLEQEDLDAEIEKARERLGDEFANQLRKLTPSDRVRDLPFKVLVTKGHFPEETANKVASKFYEKVRNCIGAIPERVNLDEPQKVVNSVDFNPENGAELSEPRPFNLMLQTYVGPIQSPENIAYLRPETAQAIFAQFKNVLETSRQRVPFGIAQVGKAFRNEVTPRNFTFRSREFEQMELEFFIKPDEVVEAIHGSVFTVQGSGLENSEPGTLNPEPQPNWGWQAWHKYWVEERVRFYEGIGLSRATLGFHIQTKEELAHYARACTDILFKFPFSKKDADGNVAGDELEGIAARSDFDLSQHQRFSGKPMGVFDDELRAAWTKLSKEKQDDLWKRYYDNRKNYLTKSAKPDETAEQISKQATDDANGLAKGQYIPHVIEPSAGVDRLILALIANAYSEVTETDDKGKSETRVTMKFHPRVAPIKVAVLPLMKNKPEIVKKAQEIRDLLRPWMNVFYDEAGSIGRRYARQDEAGTPFCVTIDFDTLGEKPELLDTVTIRYRDDGKQERIAIDELLNWLLPKIR